MNNQKSRDGLRLLRILSLTGVFAALIVVFVSFVIRSNNLKKIEENIVALNQPFNELELVEATIVKLNEIDNNFRYYTLFYEKDYFIKYKNGLSFISEAIDSLKKTEIDNSIMNQTDSAFQKKISLEESYIRLKNLNDSIQLITSLIDSFSVYYTDESNSKALDLRRQKDIKIEIDTVSSVNTTETTKKPGLIGKLFGSTEKTETTEEIRIRSKSGDSLSNKGEENSGSNSTTLLINHIKEQYLNYFSKKIDNYVAQQQQLRDNEKKLILTNLNLLRKVEEIFEFLKVSYTDDNNKQIEEALKKVSNSTKTIAFVAMGGFIVILLLALLTIINLQNVASVQAKLREEKLKAENEVVAKGKFLAFMSHELRTPLFAISGFIEQLSFTKLDIEQEKYANIVQKSVDTLLLTVNDILDHSSLSYGKPRLDTHEFTITQIINEIKPDFDKMISSKNLNFETIITGDKGLVLSGDTFRLKQVYYNLISNAINFTKQGKIIVECAIERNGENAILRSRIIDTGAGIPKEAVTELFKEFTQVYNFTQNSRQGTGLGLSICKKIIEHQGGEISVESELGKGSVFSFSIEFPIVKNPTNKYIVIKTEIDISKVKGLNVIYVDDTEVNLMLLKAMISKWNVKLDTASNGEEALELIKKNDYNLVLTDINMPKMNGFELTKEIRSMDDKLKSECPIIAVTADVMQNSPEYSLDNGIDDFLFKPFKTIDLFNMIIKYYLQG